MDTEYRVRSRFMRNTVLRVSRTAIAKGLVPPALLNAAHRRRPTLTGRYETYHEAAQACTGSYSDAELVALVIERTAAENAKIGNRRALHWRTDNSSPLPFLAMVSDGPLTVVDFGGGAGHHHTHARPVLSGPLDWHIIETEAMVNAAEERFADDELHFHRSIEDYHSTNPGPVDALFASGALHLCPDPLGTLAELLELRPRVVYLCRLPVVQSQPGWWSVQHTPLSAHGPGQHHFTGDDRVVHYPSATLQAAEVDAVLSAAGYDVRMVTQSERPETRHDTGETVHHYGYLAASREVTRNPMLAPPRTSDFAEKERPIGCRTSSDLIGRLPVLG